MHVREYQDNNGRALSLAEQLSVTADAKAKLAMQEAIQEGEEVSEIDNIKGSIHIVSCTMEIVTKLISSYIKKEIVNTITRYELIEYQKKKKKLPTSESERYKIIPLCSKECVQ